MTGFSYICISKYIEIGKIIPPKEPGLTQQVGASQSTQIGKAKPLSASKPLQVPKTKKSGKRINLFSPIASDSEEDKVVLESSDALKRKFKHYSMVQNKPVYIPDLVPFENKVMLSVDVPRYFHFDLNKGLTPAEVEYQRRMKETVVYFTMKESIDAGKLSNLFNTYGDINVRN